MFNVPIIFKVAFSSISPTLLIYRVCLTCENEEAKLCSLHLQKKKLRLTVLQLGELLTQRPLLAWRKTI